MANYAVVENNLIVNVVYCEDPAVATEQGWMALDGPEPWIGWTWDGNNWQPPPQPKDE